MPTRRPPATDLRDRMGGHGSAQPGGDLLVEETAQEFVVVRADHVDDRLVGQGPGPGGGGHPRSLGQVGADEPLGIIQQSNSLGRIDMGVAGEEAAGVGVGVFDHRVDDGVRQDPIPAQHHPCGKRSVREQPQEDALRHGRVESQPGEPTGGEIGVRPDLLRRRHALYPQGVKRSREDLFHDLIRLAQRQTECWVVPSRARPDGRALARRASRVRRGRNTCHANCRVPSRGPGRRRTIVTEVKTQVR